MFLEGAFVAETQTQEAMLRDLMAVFRLYTYATSNRCIYMHVSIGRTMSGLLSDMRARRIRDAAKSPMLQRKVFVRHHALSRAWRLEEMDRRVMIYVRKHVAYGRW